MYGKGLAETILGEWLQKQNRKDFVVASKVRCPMGPGQNDVGLSRKHIIQSCEDSLERLKTDYLDLYQTHIWDAGTPVEETFRTFDDLVRIGKVRYVGVSNYCGWQLQKVVDVTKSMGLTPAVSLQQQYNLLCRRSELEEFQVCANEGIGILPWSPLKGGTLTGKFKRGETPSPDDSRMGAMATDESRAVEVAPAWSGIDKNERYWTLIKRMQEIGDSHGDKSVAQVALRWLLQKNIVPSVIIGVTSVKQLEENVGASSGWKIAKEQMEELDLLSQIDSSYPYNIIQRINEQRQNCFQGSSLLQNIY